MKNLTRNSALAVIVLLTILSGYMQGKITRRWGASDKEKKVAAKLLDLPANLGEWTTVQEGQLDDSAVEMLEPLAHLARFLKSPGSRLAVSMTLIVGPPGQTGAHTPEVCVSGIGYDQLGERELISITHPEHPELQGTFWLATFRSKSHDRHILREYWAWSTGGPWEASSTNRTGYAGFPYLYKVQLGCRLPAGSDPALADPTPNLLEALVAISPDYLISPTRN